jgi:FkbM family methyltransferase
MWGENVYQLHAGDFANHGVVVDVGANIGAVTVWAAAHGARVIAVEPQPDNLRLLRQNIADNKVDATVYERAVGTERGEVFISDRHGNSKVGTDGTSVQMVRLEDVFTDHGITECAVLKIDIEGSEYPLIAGASIETLNMVRYLTMEFDGATDEVFGGMIAKLAKVFNTHIIGSPERGGYIYAHRY